MQNEISFLLGLYLYIRYFFEAVWTEWNNISGVAYVTKICLNPLHLQSQRYYEPSQANLCLLAFRHDKF